MLVEVVEVPLVELAVGIGHLKKENNILFDL